MKWSAILLLSAALLARAAENGDAPTFSRDIGPLLREKCGACHNNDGLAPFSLVNYADVRPRAGKVARIALDRLMPPWLPSHGGFADARRLTGREVGLLRRWIEADAPEGDREEVPNPVPPEWQLGKPDEVLSLSTPHLVPADGRLQTVHFVFPLGLKEERYLRAVEVLPGNRHVVLQANILFDRSGRARELAGRAGWYERFGGSGFAPTGFIPAFTPGRAPLGFEDGTAMTLAVDTDLVLQIRYRPSGRPEMDFTRFGLYFAPEAPQRAPSGVMLGNEDLRIPPDKTEKVIRDQITLAAPLEVREIRPNLLLFGRGIRAWAEQPDGRRIPLLEIQDWDFTWQETYRLAQPFLLPKGTRVHVEWTIVNDAKHELRAGDTPENEAPGLWIGGVAASWADHIALAGANLRHYTDLVNAARARK